MRSLVLYVYSFIYSFFGRLLVLWLLVAVVHVFRFLMMTVWWCSACKDGYCGCSKVLWW